jgi:hypothetical protein
VPLSVPVATAGSAPSARAASASGFEKGLCFLERFEQQRFRVRSPLLWRQASDDFALPVDALPSVCYTSLAIVEMLAAVAHTGLFLGDEAKQIIALLEAPSRTQL